MTVSRRMTHAACVLGLTSLAAAPALADVKAGVDAWSRGDYKKAVDEWRPDAVAGNPDAQFDLGQAYKLGRGVPVDLGQAEIWYGKAAAQGHVQAEDNYGLTLFQNGKRAEAVRWLERSVARGEPRAQLVLGTMLFNGDAVDKDWVRAYALLTRSAASGLPQGAKTLAQMDQYIPTDVRQQGIALARQYELGQASYASNSPEIAGPSSPGDMRSADLPASTAAADNPTRAAPLRRQPPREVAEARPAPPPPAPPPAAATPPVRTPAPAPAPTVRSVAGKGWRFQVGAFRDEGNARGLWQQIHSKVGSAGDLQPYFIKSGTLTKLQIGNLASSGDVARVCGEVKSRIPGTPCVPIAP